MRAVVFVVVLKPKSFADNIRLVLLDNAAVVQVFCFSGDKDRDLSIQNKQIYIFIQG